ncbi:GNAT family N-acetyltransferase [Luteolibacter soli]|uniref:GNAT family N-acetyltransferase n=1 Tax=Luteolibacter soli TaxID=3135280 RepID=A0ABU9AYW0_9BACT
MEPLALRPVTDGDRDFLADVYASTRAEELEATGWTDAEKAGFCRMQFDAQDAHYRQHYPGARFEVIESAGVAVGRLYVDRWPREIRIMDITLLPGHRGKGIGTRLLEELQQEAAASGKLLSIHVERMNPALKLYDRLGFQLIEDKGVYLLLGWTAGAKDVT